MKIARYSSFNEFEAANVSGLYEHLAIVKNSANNTLCADLLTECKSWKTAVKRFARGIASVPEFGSWGDSIFESCEFGIFSARETHWDDKKMKDVPTVGGWAYEVEDLGDNTFYIMCITQA